jgi:BlaR1 peptidase M56
MILSSLIPTLLYLAKMTAISALFFLYYRMFLQNAHRHDYNRFYLLGTMILALLIPIMRLPFPAAWTAAIRAADLFIPSTPATPVAMITAKRGPSSAGWLMTPLLSIYCVIAYTGVALLFLWPLLRSLSQLLRLSRSYASERGPGYRLYRTRETGTPFSFFHHLFWNEAIPLDTPKGQAILQHELAHIRQQHSLDLLCFETIRALAWCNPFFHLQLRELKLVHEFLADRQALQIVTPQRGGSVRTDYAEWLVLEAAGSARASTHSFYSNHLQKRITMILQTSRPRGFLRQTAVLPLTILLCCGFAKTPPAIRSPQAGS